MNVYFWFVLMMAFSAVWLMVFLKRPLKNNTVNLQTSNIALGKQKQVELQQNLAQGLIGADVFAQAQDDIAKTLAQELAQTDEKITKRESPIWLSGLIIALMVALSLGIYQLLTPKAPVQAPALDVQIMPLSLEASAVRLQNYLLEKPSDADAWQMLALTYFELKQLDKSLDAYDKSYQLNPKNPRLLVEYASSIAIKNDNDFSGRPIELVKQALELSPNAPDALYMAGLYAVSQQDLKLAGLLWRKALAGLASDSTEHKVLIDVLAELSELRGEPAPVVQSVHTIEVNVVFSEQILSNSSQQDYVMIYAKAAVGRPMPIAIVKIKLKDFTGQVILDDSHSIVPSNVLSQARDVLIVARLSKTGAAFRQADDVQTTSEVIRVGDNPVVNLKVQ